MCQCCAYRLSRGGKKISDIGSSDKNTACHLQQRALLRGFGVLSTDASTCGQVEAGIKPPVLGFIADCLTN